MLYCNILNPTKEGCIIALVSSEDEGTGWPDGMLFRASYIEWQATLTATMYLMGNAILAAETGLGKTVMSLGLAGMAMEDGQVDLVLVVCERNKLAEWLADFARFTRIPAAGYWGPRRRELLGSLPGAVITTYETCRQDAAVFPPKGSRARSLAPGPLMEAMRGRRVLVIYDEVTRLGRRSTALYKAHKFMLDGLRAAYPGTRCAGLSATPMDTDLENVYNEARLVIPGMPLVKDFEENVIAGRDDYGRPRYKPGGREWLRERVGPWILRKRASDPDVRDQLPPPSEKFRRILMKPDQYRAYQALEDLAWDEDGQRQEVPGLSVLLRQMAGDPWAVLEAARAGDSPLAAMIAEEMGGELEKCSSAKAEELISLADLVMSSGGKLLAFTFFGQTVLPALRRRLGDRPVFTYHGGMPQEERDRALAGFRSHPGGAIMLASDAMARGVNVPEVTVIAEYEVARTHSGRTQRRGRGHRLGREGPLTFITFILESSIEGTTMIRTLLRRNGDQDFILGDEGADGYVTAGDRRDLFAQARPRKAG